MPPPRKPRTMVCVETTGQFYKQVPSFTYLGGATIETPDMSVEIVRWTRACWMRIRQYLHELSLKTRMLKAEAIKALLYVCSTLTLCQEHYSQLRTVHHRGLLRIIGAQSKKPGHRMTLYSRALEIGECESVETALFAREAFCGQGAYSNERRAVAKANHVSKSVKE